MLSVFSVIENDIKRHGLCVFFQRLVEAARADFRNHKKWV